jgi:hypothetical protein
MCSYILVKTPKKKRNQNMVGVSLAPSVHGVSSDSVFSVVKIGKT